jgi:hypothetical protein
VLSLPASAAALSFGANLERPANNTLGCQALVPYQQVDSCSFSTSGALNSLAETLGVPGTGTVTQVQVKVGPRTGPMRVAVLESLRKENSGEAACCIGRAESAPFTPQPNAVTTVSVDLPVSVTFNQESKIHAFDGLFLSMDDSSTPIPANVANEANGGNCSGGWFPAVHPGQENFTGPYGVCGTTILLHAEWQPAAGTAAAGEAAPSPPCSSPFAPFPPADGPLLAPPGCLV